LASDWGIDGDISRARERRRENGRSLSSKTTTEVDRAIELAACDVALFSLFSISIANR